MLLCCIIPSSSGKNQHSAQEVARRVSGAVAGESTQKSIYQVPITTLISRITLFAICLSFSLPLFTLTVLFALSLLYPPSLSLFAYFCPLAFCLLVCWTACLSRWLKITINCVTLPIPTAMILLALRLLLLPMLNLVKLMPLC